MCIITVENKLEQCLIILKIYIILVLIFAQQSFSRIFWIVRIEICVK